MTDFVPLSRETDPVRRAQRMRVVEANLRRNRMERRGVAACESCGGGNPLDGVDGDDVCRCGSLEVNWEARVWSAAANCRRSA